MTARERAEAVKAAMVGDWAPKRGGSAEHAHEDGRRLVFDKEPDFIYDKQGEIIGVDAWVRLYDENGAEVRIDPHRRIINPPTVPRSGINRIPDETKLSGMSRIVTPDPKAAFLEAVWDSVTATPNPRGWRTSGTVTTVFGSTGDGVIQSTNATYATARSGSNLIAFTDDASNVFAGQFNLAGEYTIYEGFIAFDTSAITDSDTVSVVTLDLWLLTDNSDTDFTCEARDFNWGASLTTADWVAGASLGGNTLVASISSSGIGATGAYKTFTSQAAFLTVTNIKTGTVHLIIDSSRHVAGSAPASSTLEYLTWDDADATGTTQDPKLTITHASAGKGPMNFQQHPLRIWRR